MAWLHTWFDISNTYDKAWSIGVGQKRKIDKKHDKYCVEEGFQLARVKLNKDGEGCSKAPRLRNFSINISDGSEQK